MAFLNETFEADQLPQTSNYNVLPAGWYTANITGAELKATKAGTGQYIAVRYDITGPTHQGRVVFGNINIKNPNPKAEEIGRQQLGDIMRAIGLSKVTDTDQLIGGSLSVKLDIRKSEDYGPSNDVKGFKAITGSMPTMPSSPEAAAPVPKASNAPWAKK
jgi:hypothetical protein